MTREPNEQVEAIRKDLRYLQLLSNSFPTSAEASTEIINLELLASEVLRAVAGSIGLICTIPITVRLVGRWHHTS